MSWLVLLDEYSTSEFIKRFKDRLVKGWTVCFVVADIERKIFTIHYYDSTVFDSVLSFDEVFESAPSFAVSWDN